MKKTLILLTVVALGAGTMSSCKKSNKGKMSGEWNLTEMTSTSATTSGSPSVTNTETMTITGTTLTYTESDGTNTNTTNGTVNTATWSINKDGSYTRTLDFTFTDTYDDWTGTTHTVTSNQKDEESGTWSFVKKNKTNEYKTNERVSFMATGGTTTTTNSDTPAGGTATTSTDVDTYTYADGSNVSVFLITESKKKSLTMTTDEGDTYSNSSTSGGTTTTSSSTTVGSTTVTMSQE